MKRYVLWAFFILYSTVLTPPAAAEIPDRAGLPFDGRWKLVFELPDGYYTSPVEFVTKEDGRVDFTVLGSLGDFNITSGSGRVSGRSLILSAATSWGRLKLKVTREGERLRGAWSPAGFFAGLLFKGEIRGVRDVAATGAPPRMEIFDEVCRQLGSRFYDPRFNGADWDGARLRYRRLVETARTDGEFLTAVRMMLKELNSSHLEFFAAPGADPVWAPKRGVQNKSITWKRLAPSVGYLRINSFDEDEAQSVASVDRAFQELGGLPALVIDVRGNGGGGAVGLAVRLGDYLLGSRRPVGYYVTRAGLARLGLQSIDQVPLASLPVFSGYDSNDFGRLLEQHGGALIAAGGGAARPYRGRVLVLIDEYCYSAAEAFAAVIKEARAGTLVGRRTAGRMLGADYVSLPGGWALILPVMDFRTAGGVRVEGAGVEPDVTIEAKKSGDPELAGALRLLRASGVVR